MGKNLHATVCGCGELCYYGSTICSECDATLNRMMKDGVSDE